MSEIGFGDFKFTKVTRGSLGGKFIIPSDVQVMKYNIPKSISPLPIKKEQLLKQHARHHTKRHIDYMRQTMLSGLTFKAAHQRATQFIGR